MDVRIIGFYRSHYHRDGSMPGGPALPSRLPLTGISSA